MRLKRLELQGFKSFADRTVLTFDHSLVGIVGPNGCGKSNVVDAIRWVLGEQRPTSMRGGEMIDVIFKGSVSRPPLSVAEVSLVLDNAGGELGERGAEVAITRRVDRSGEGEYLINGDKVRLKDVRDMLYDTGLGSRGYAVLEQGRIDAVLSANPLDRRAIFEEAAGVSRYRQRRKETEARLKRVELDMQRLDDVLRELGSRVRSLKIQAGKAERYVAARDEWRHERARFLKHRVHGLDRALAELRGRIAQLDAQSEELRGARGREVDDAAAREREQRELSAEVDRLADEVTRLAGECRAQGERQSQLQERVRGSRVAAEEQSSRALELTRSLELREAELESARGEREQSAAHSSAVEARFAAEAAQLADVQRSYQDVKQECERANRSLLATLSEKNAAQNALCALEESRAPLAERRSRAAARLAEAERTLADLCAVEGRARQRTQEGESDSSRAEQGRAESLRRLTAHDQRAAELTAERTRLELERARVQSRIDALLDWEREREALEAGARALLTGVESGEAPCTRDKLVGVLADHLRTGTRTARALDAALGERALALVTEDAQTAARLLSWLSDRRAGAVRLVVPGGLARRARDKVRWSEAEAAQVEGRLLDAIESSPRLFALAEALVGDVWIARDLGAAVELVAAHPELRFVTLAGDLVDAAGLFGGHREIAQGAVGRRSSAHELEAAREALAHRLEELATELGRLADARSGLEGERGNAELELERARERLNTARSEAHAARARLQDLEGTLTLLTRECQSVGAEAERVEQDLVGLAERSKRAEDLHVEGARKLSELEQALAGLERRRDELVQNTGELQADLARARAESSSLERRAADLARGAEEIRVELERTRKAAREHAENAQSSSSEAARLKDVLTSLGEERTGVEKRLAELRSTERAGRDALEGFRRRVDLVTRELESLSKALSEQRLEEQRLALENAELVTRAGEDLQLSEFDLRVGFQPEPELGEPACFAELEARMLELKQNLDKLGPVNTEAVGELVEAERRFDFLDGERKDLLGARQTLESTLATINQESERLFLETFHEVRGHFQSLFRQLFGGGKADLALAPGEGPLEAGIEISARPPGREMLPIGLLSGGQRTLTALALLFAVFQARPSPFCVLDEVDAALDDANVGRFLAMLDGFRQGTQFLVVTHNKGTMAACLALYGITMEVKGVSRNVMVQFGEVDRIDPHAIGNANAASVSRAAQRDRPADDEDRTDELDQEPSVEVVPVPRRTADEEAQSPAEVAGS